VYCLAFMSPPGFLLYRKTLSHGVAVFGGKVTATLPHSPPEQVFLRAHLRFVTTGLTSGQHIC